MEYTAYQLLWFFLCYAFLGWLCETVLAAAKKHRLINCGFLNTPFSPIYGLAAVLFAVFLPELRFAPFFLFLFGMIIATGLELFTGIFLEKIFSQKWWDYSEERFQFEGHICLKYSLIWGLLSLGCVFFGNPLLARLVELIPVSVGQLVVLGIFCLLTADLFSSVTALFQLNGSLKEPGQLSRRLRRLTNSLDNTVTRYVQRRMARAYPNLEPEQLRERVAQKTAQRVEGVFAAGCGFYKLVWLFFIGAFLGDIIETIFCRVTAGVWMSRSSVVYGPFSIIWGLGAVLLTAVLYKYRHKSDSTIFLVGTVVGGAYEYLCSVFTELVFGTVFWDYSHLPFNLGGRINLLYCFFWGIAAVVWLKLIYPKLSGLIEKLPVGAGKWWTWLLIVFMLVNVIISSLAMARYTQRQAAPAPPVNAVEEFLDTRFDDERMARIYPNAIVVK